MLSIPRKNSSHSTNSHASTYYAVLADIISEPQSTRECSFYGEDLALSKLSPGAF